MQKDKVKVQIERILMVYMTAKQRHSPSAGNQTDSFSRLDRSGELFRPCLSRGWYTEGGYERLGISEIGLGWMDDALLKCHRALTVTTLEAGVKRMCNPTGAAPASVDVL